MKYLTFVEESNKIERIMRPVSSDELDAHAKFMEWTCLTTQCVEELVKVCQPDALLRSKVGLDVRVGIHVPPPGGLHIVRSLDHMLDKINDRELDPFEAHLLYETLHPFTDGNGRSGRAIWLWQMLRDGQDAALDLGFLHIFYYQSLQARR